MYGVSTACLYPIDTHKALVTLASLGVKKTEIFLNTFSEIKPQYLEKLKNTAQNSNIDVVSVHPFSSNLEPFFFASDYQARFDDGVILYKELFKSSQILGAKILVYHGDFKASTYDFKKYCQNYQKLRNIGLEYGVTLCQENVVRCKCSTTRKIEQMRDILNNDVDFVFDSKQSLRSGVPVQEMLKAMDGKIKHIHISDYTEKNDCVLPGEGKTDFAMFESALKAQKYNGEIIIEVYKDAYQTPEQLVDAVNYLKSNINL